MSEQSERVYPSDVSDEEWAFVSPDLALVREDAPRREHDLRAVYNGLRYIVKTGAPWRSLPVNFPPWWVVHQQAQRWSKAAVFEAVAHHWRVLLRLAAQREHAAPSAAMLDSRTLQSTPESGARGGYDGAQRRKGSKLSLSRQTPSATCSRCP